MVSHDIYFTVSSTLFRDVTDGQGNTKFVSKVIDTGGEPTALGGNSCWVMVLWDSFLRTSARSPITSPVTLPVIGWNRLTKTKQQEHVHVPAVEVYCC